MSSDQLWPRPVPTVGDRTSAAERAADPAGWAFPADDRDALERIMSARRDIRRFRPDPIPDAVLRQLLEAAHTAPSVGHSQPWRLVVVADPITRARAATLADQARLQQAAAMEPDAGRHLLDLDLEGIREAPLGIVVCCDRRVPAAGVLGRATFPDVDMWSCACAIQNLWLAARAGGTGCGLGDALRAGPVGRADRSTGRGRDARVAMRGVAGRTAAHPGAGTPRAGPFANRSPRSSCSNGGPIRGQRRRRPGWRPLSRPRWCTPATGRTRS